MKIRRIWMVTLVLALFTLALTLAVSAETLATEPTFSSVVMNVGKDESERNLTWFSDRNASGEVRYAEVTEDGSFPSEYKTAKAVAVKATASGYYSYKATMVGLVGGKSYVYRLVVGDTVSEVYSFSVSEAEDGFSFAFITDPQIHNSTAGAGWRATLDAILKQAPDVALIVSGGDQTSDPTSEGNYAEFLADALTEVAISTSIGPSHDNASPYRDHYNLPNLSSRYGVSNTGSDYFYTYGNVLFLHLNVESGDFAGHVAFMENAIADHPEAQWRVVVLHYSFFSGGNHSEDSAVQNFRNAMAGEFTSHGIDLVLSGHDHVYSRSQMMLDATTVSGDVVTDDTVTDPVGTLYLCGTNASGSGFYDGYKSTFDPYVAKYSDDNRRGMVLFEVTDGALVMKSYFTDGATPELMDSFTIYKTQTQSTAPAVGYAITYVADPDALFGDGTDLSAYTARTYTAATPDAPTIFMPKGSLAQGALYEWSWVYYTMDGEIVDTFLAGENYLAYLKAETTAVSNTLYIAMENDPASYTYTWATAWGFVQDFAGESFTLKLAEDVTLSSTDAITLTLPASVTIDLCGKRLDGSAVANGLLIFSTGSTGSDVSLITSVEGGTVACGTKSVFFLNSNSSSVVTLSVGSEATSPVTVSSCAYLADAGNNFKNSSKLSLTVTGGTYTVSGGVTKVTNLKDTSGKDTYLLNLKDATVLLGGASANVIGQYGTGRNAHKASVLTADGCTFRNAYGTSVRSFLAVDCFEGAMTFTDCTFDGVSLDAKGHSLASAITVGEGCSFQNGGATLGGNPLAFVGTNVSAASGCVIARTDAVGSAKVVKKADAVAITWANPVGYTDHWMAGVTPKYFGEASFTAGNNAFTLVLADEITAASADKTYAFTTPEGYLFRLDGDAWQVSYDNGASYNDLAAAAYAISVDVDGTVTNYGASTDLATLLSELDASGAKNITVTLGKDMTLAATTLAGKGYKLSIDLAGYALTLAGAISLSGDGYDVSLFSSQSGAQLVMGTNYFQPNVAGTLTLGSSTYKNTMSVSSLGAKARVVSVGQLTGGTLSIRYLYCDITSTSTNYGILRPNAKGTANISLQTTVLGCTVRTAGSPFMYHNGTQPGNGGICNANSLIEIRDSEFISTASSAVGLFGHAYFTDRYYGKVSIEGTSFTGYVLNGDLLLSDATVGYTYNTYAQNLPANYDPTKCITVGKGCSFTNYGTTFDNAFAFTASNVTIAPGCILSVKSGSVTIEEAPPASATFRFYESVGATSPIASQIVTLGNVAVGPILAIRAENGKFYAVGGWTVFDASGNALGSLFAVTSEMDGKFYDIYPEWVEIEVAFAIVDGEEYDYRTEGDFTAENLNGKRIVLYSDVRVSETLANVKIDLNGYSITTMAQLSTTGCYLYNSNTEAAATVYLNHVLYTGQYAKIWIGYSDADTKANGRITMVYGVSASGSGGHGNYGYYYNVDFVTTKANGATTTVLGQMQGDGAYVAENCNFYCNEYGILVNINRPRNATVTLTDCNVYFAKGGQISGGWSKKDGYDLVINVYLNNTHVYGLSAAANTGWKYVLGEGTSFNAAPYTEGYSEQADGTMLLPTNATSTVSFAYTLADGTPATFEGVYAAGTKVGTERDLRALYATFLRNVNLDVSINFNLYIPTTYTLAGEYDTIEIDGVEYYVVTVKTAPKDATGDNFIPLTINGVECQYNASLVSYMKALLNLDPETSAYVADSQKVAKYVLYYVKSAALAAYGEVDTTAIDALLEGFTLSETDKTITGAIENVTAITGVTGATLDLNSNVGIVIRVAADYVGTITVKMAGESVVETYETAGESDRFIVIGDIEIFRFTNNVVVTNSEGETLTYNLATYVNAKQTEVGYATYAYAMAAKAYHKAYAIPETVG